MNGTRQTSPLSAGAGLARLVSWSWLGLFVALPLAMVVRISLSDAVTARPPYMPLFDAAAGLAGLSAFLGALDLDAYGTLVTDGLYLSAFLTSLRIAALATLLVVLLAFPIALALARAPRQWQPMLLLAVVVPFWTSFLIRVYAWIAILKPQGVLNALAQAVGFGEGATDLLNTEAAILIGLVYAYLPFMILPVFAVLERIDGGLVDAARGLGASRTRILLTILLPLSRPGLIAGVLLVFIPMLGEFVIPDLLGGSDTLMVGRLLWAEFFANRDWPMAAALAVLLLATVLVPLGLARLAAEWGSHPSVPGSLSGDTMATGDVAVLGLGFAFLYGPIAILVALSFNASRLVTVWGGFSPQWYRGLSSNAALMDAAATSLTVACTSATLATLIATTIALVLGRGRNAGAGLRRGRLLMLALLFTPVVMPEIIVGLSALLLFVALDIERGWATLVLTHAVYATGFSCVLIQARLSTMETVLEEVAASLGASPVRVFGRVTLPLLFPALAAAWMLAFALSLDDLVLASFVSGPGATTLPMRIFSQARLGVTPEINALCTIMIGGVGFLAALSLRLTRRVP